MRGEMAEFVPAGGVVIVNEAVGVDAEGEMAVVANPAVQTTRRGAGCAQGGADFFPVVVDVALQDLHRIGGEHGDGSRSGQRGIHPDKIFALAQLRRDFDRGERKITQVMMR